MGESGRITNMRLSLSSVVFVGLELLSHHTHTHTQNSIYWKPGKKNENNSTNKIKNVFD